MQIFLHVTEIIQYIPRNKQKSIKRILLNVFIVYKKLDDFLAWVTPEFTVQVVSYYLMVKSYPFCFIDKVTQITIFSTKTSIIKNVFCDYS